MSQISLSIEYYVSLASCRNGTFYAGCTKNVRERIAAHYAGHRGRYTRANRSLSLIAVWPFNHRIEARLAERELKGLSHECKHTLAQALEFRERDAS